MAVIDLYSKRAARAAGQVPDVYRYDELPAPLRTQIVHIWRAAIGVESRYAGRDIYNPDEIYQFIVDTLRKEYGVFHLTGRRAPSVQEELVQWFLGEQSVENCLDAVELTARLLSSDLIPQEGAAQANDDAVDELNKRFREHGIGYRFESDHFIRIDSELVHQQVVKPALLLLMDRRFATANEEFLKAHQEYRQGNFPDALVDCCKAFESVLKIICAESGWPVPPNATAKALLDVVFQNGLVPSYLQSQFAGLRSVLEAGVPTLRNKSGGHGGGAAPHRVPAYLASYQLHQTAAAIVMLVGAFLAEE